MQKSKLILIKPEFGINDNARQTIISNNSHINTYIPKSEFSSNTLARLQARLDKLQKENRK